MASIVKERRHHQAWGSARRPLKSGSLAGLLNMRKANE
jgi:hypothetical protein